MKARYIGPGTADGEFKTEDLTIGKDYEVLNFYDVEQSLIVVKGDAGHTVIGVIKGKARCLFEEYFELVNE